MRTTDPDCTNCGGWGCMDCVLRYQHDQCTHTCGMCDPEKVNQQGSNLKYHRPRAEGVLAVQLTAENAHAVARELGGRIEEDPKPGDPTDVAMWLIVPTLDGVERLLVGTGPVVGRGFSSGRVVAWANPRDFYATYEELTR